MSTSTAVTLRSAGPVDTVTILALPRDILVNCIEPHLCPFCIIRLSSTCRRFFQLLDPKSNGAVDQYKMYRAYHKSDSTLKFAAKNGYQCIIDHLKRRCPRLDPLTNESKLEKITDGVNRNELAFRFLQNCLDGNTVVIEKMIQQEISSITYPALSDALTILTVKGHIDIIKTICQLYIHDIDFINLGFHKAVVAGNCDIIEYFVSIGANTHTVFRSGLLDASFYGQRESIELLSKKATYDKYTWKQCLQQAYYGGHIDIANLIITKGDLKIPLVVAK